MKRDKKKKITAFGIINQCLTSNKAKLECERCYLLSKAMGLSCGWINSSKGVCRDVIKKDIEYTIENC